MDLSNIGWDLTIQKIILAEIFFGRTTWRVCPEKNVHCSPKLWHFFMAKSWSTKWFRAAVLLDKPVASHVSVVGWYRPRCFGERWYSLQWFNDGPCRQTFLRVITKANHPNIEQNHQYGAIIEMDGALLSFSRLSLATLPLFVGDLARDGASFESWRGRECWRNPLFDW